MAETNALSDLLGAGIKIGAAYADREIYGSTPASNQQLANQTAAYNAVNGSGPVNQQAALNAPMSWTDLFYGPPATTNTTNAPRQMGMVTKVALALVVALVVWLIVSLWKKA